MAGQARWRRGRRLAGGLLAVAGLAAALAWLAGTESFLVWLAGRAVAASAGRLVLQGVRGSLYGPVKIALVAWDTPQRRIAARDMELDWSPAALLRGRVEITRSAARSVAVEVRRPSPAPLTPPRTLRLPLPMAVPGLSVDRIDLSLPQGRFTFDRAGAGLRYADGRYHLTGLRAVTPWGQAHGDLSLAADAPFPLDGKASLQQTGGPHSYAAHASVTGFLARIGLAAQASAAGAGATVEAVLTPFAVLPLERAALRVRHLDPARFGRELPRADLGLDLDLRGTAPNRFRGSLSLANGLPGTVDQGRWPLKQAATGFAGTLDRLSLQGVVLDLGAAGRFSGQGAVRARRLELDLETRDFDLHGVQGKLWPTRLSGRLHLAADQRAQRASGEFSQRRYRIRFEARHEGGRVELRNASVHADGSELQLAGGLSLAGSRAFSLSGALGRFNPADFGAYPEARINGKFEASGQLAPNPRGRVEFAVADSRYRGYPLSARGKGSIADGRIRDADLTARLGDNRLSARGAFGRPGDRLDWQVDAGELALIGPDFSGRVRASGRLEGTPAEPAGRFELAAEKLRWTARYGIARLRARGSMDKGLQGPLALAAECDGCRLGGFILDRATLAGRGTRSRHLVSLTARNPAVDLRAELAGGLEKGGWSGELRQLVNRGRLPGALQAPARLVVAPGRLVFSGGAFEVADGTLSIAEISRVGGRLATRGRFDRLSLAALQRLSAKPIGIETSLRIGGSWAVTADDSLNGTVAVARESGDVAMLTQPPTALGLERLSLRFLAVNGRLTGALEAAGSTLGSVSASAATTLTKRDRAWGVAGDTAVHLAADATMPSIAWLSPLLDKTGRVLVDGGVRAQLRADGTMRHPGLGGTVTANAVKLEIPDQGVSLRDGRLQVVLEDDGGRLTGLVLHGGEGTLSGSGALSLEQGRPVLHVVLVADRLAALSRPDRLLVLSGTAQAEVRGSEAQLRADLKADRGLIELPRAETPTLSSDVVVLGRKKEEPVPSVYRVVTDLALDLGSDFHLKGRGLDAQLGGALKVRGEDGRLRANGTIRVVKGSYSAYGQQLAIDRGALNFSGPIDNPGLDVVAMRKNQPVEAGVSLTGTALAPRVRLVSNPDVPDSEKLSWLVLGHGMDTAQGAEFDALQAAAGALLSAGESVTLQSRIAHAAGLDQFSLAGAGGLGSTVLTLGKRLSSRVYVGYEQGLTGATSVVRINYTLSKRLSLRTQSGTDNAVDLFYTFSFD